MKRLWFFALVLATAACGGASQPPAQPGYVAILVGATCPPPSPIPTPWPAVLIYPIPGATNVPTNTASIVFVGSFDATYGPGQYTLTAAGGVPVALPSPTSAPSPLPSPSATLTPDSPYTYLSWPYEAIPIPTLSSATTYSFGYNATGYDAANPPTCRLQYSQGVGTFTTR